MNYTLQINAHYISAAHHCQMSNRAINPGSDVFRRWARQKKKAALACRLFHIRSSYPEGPYLIRLFSNVNAVLVLFPTALIQHERSGNVLISSGKGSAS